MQTFLPSLDFEETARLLDYRRLGKQRVEAAQLLKATIVSQYGWSNHPAAVMWRPYRNALALYHNAMISEWVSRGYRNTMELLKIEMPVVMPWWMGDQAFHASHRSNLLRKDHTFYSAHGWSETPDKPYLWPNSPGQWQIGVLPPPK